MIINGKEVELDYKKAQQIQDKFNTINNMPDNSKQEVGKKDLKQMSTFNFSDDDFNSQLGDGYGINNNTLLTGKNAKQTRAEYYRSFQEMSECNFIHRGLEVIADDCCQKNKEGNCIKIYSDDDEIKEILEDLFYKRLNINMELWSIFYETCKLGDNFYEIIPDSYTNPTMIARIRYLDPDKVNRIEKNGKLAFYTYIQDIGSDTQDLFGTNQNFIDGNNKENQTLLRLEPWQIIHFKISDKDFYPYGGSLLKAGQQAFKRLQLLEDGMVIYRLARVPERRVFKIDTGNLPRNEAMRAVQKIKDNYRTSQILDDNGNINRNASALSLTQDIFIPVSEGSSGTNVETLAGGTALQNIDDIHYFRDEILWTMNIPPDQLGTTSDANSNGGGRGSLAMQDIKFARFAERIQQYINEGIIKIAAEELFFKHKKKSDLNNFKIEFTPPSNIKEVMDIEYLNQKMQLIQAMQSTSLFPKKFILKYVMNMTQKEINNLNFFKSVEDSQNPQSAIGGGMDMGGMGGGMPIGGGMDMGASTAPAMSVNTEDLNDKMVKIFGKDILIEHKEDFAKIMKAANEYNENLKSEPKEDTTDEDPSYIIETLSKVLSEGNHSSTNDEAETLFWENEFGGFDFKKDDIKIFSKPHYKTGPAKSNKKKELIYEEKSIKNKK